jgi:hypothetical protein
MMRLSPLYQLCFVMSRPLADYFAHKRSREAADESSRDSFLQISGDFAQAYVIAHEVGHHVQNLLGSDREHVR